MGTAPENMVTLPKTNGPGSGWQPDKVLQKDEVHFKEEIFLKE